MKLIISLLACFTWIQLIAGCSKNKEMRSGPNNASITDSMKLKISIGTNTFTATLHNNATVIAFKKRLPMTIDMRDLNANEKYFDLPDTLPANGSNPGTIQAGDLMLYGSNTLVLFYKTFSTSYNYTPLARIEDPTGLAAALGSGHVTVTFALQ